MTSQSQAGQDRWVWEMLERKTDGYYLDLGSNHASAINNTYALEQLGWNGILVDILPGCETRKGKFFQCDAAHPTPELLAAYQAMPPIVDFLSLDCDDATFAVFRTLPWETKRFRVACIEHDAYRIGPETRNAMRDILWTMGYMIVCADVGIRFPDDSCPVGAFEDWIADPCLVNPDMMAKFCCSGKEWRDIVRHV
jgi:hypothetical protein